MEEEKVLEVASLAGHIQLENGAEISRVEETMERISNHFGIDSGNFFVLSNGIFTTGNTGYAKVEFIPFKGAQLERVVAVNQLSRDISEGKLSLEEAKVKLLDIRKMKSKPEWEQILGSAVGSAGFCAIFGGSFLDSAAAFVVGAILWTFVAFVSAPHLSKIIGNILGGFLGTVLCLLFHRFGFGESLGNMIVGSLIPLIPGVAFTNGIRDIAGEDYIAGATRLMDALMVFFCIAAGVVLSFMSWALFSGSVPVVNGTEPDPFMGRLACQAVAAFVGTLGFAVIFGVPRRNYIQTAVVATVGWISYMLLNLHTGLGVVGATLFATVVVAVFSRWFARLFKTPQTIFLITGIFPMIPGGGIFWTVFFFVSRRIAPAAHSGAMALAVTLAIVLGIVLVSSLPKQLFSKKRRKTAKKNN